MTNTQKLGIIAGSGGLPFLLASEAKQRGRQPIVISVTKGANALLSKVASELHKLHIGQLKKIVKTLREREIHELVLIGKVDKRVLLKPIWLDSLARKILAAAHKKGDHSLLQILVAELESLGFTVIDQRHFLTSLLPPAGVLTHRHPSQNEWQDINYGIDLAHKVADLDIGQTVVVKNQMPLAIEAIEGTDETIRRGGQLGGKGVIVAKAARRDHDFRFDVPAVGLNTLAVMCEVHAAALAIDAGRTFVLDMENFVKKADEHKISIVGIG